MPRGEMLLTTTMGEAAWTDGSDCHGGYVVTVRTPRMSEERGGRRHANKKDKKKKRK